MIALRNRQILIDGIPQLLMAGEIHYFRLQRADWQDRIDKLRRTGCNTVASYVPWLCHETRRGDIDLKGLTRPELDLGGFIDLCQRNGLWFIARPGPYVMAELKNEGLPYWLFERYPDIVSTGWDGCRAEAPMVDYLAPDFLDETARWYRAVMAVIRPRLQPRGGNVIAIQLDNEIGMLSWVTNTPELSDAALTAFREWLAKRLPGEGGEARDRWPLDDELAFRNGVRAPSERVAADLMALLGHFLRERYARYVEALQQRAEAAGASGVPFLINVHGSGGGRGITFPIGISQLRDSYAGRPGFTAGTDLYLGNLTPDNFQDLYICNTFLRATLGSDQPLSALEFECGDGNYGGNYGNRYAPSAADLKTRMCIAQGNRLINYYLFAGGHNYRLEPAPQDGDGRIAITGERHGIAAPVGPEGQLSYTFPALAETVRTMMAVADKLAVMEEEHDTLALGFIPDYYMTECLYPKSKVMRAIAGNLEANRGYGPWEIMVRAMLLRGYRFGAVDVQNEVLSVERLPVLALPSARHMSAALQGKLVDWLTGGGRLLLYGELPLFDMQSRACTLLVDALGLVPTGNCEATREYHLSVAAEGWASPRPEIRTHFAQTFALSRGEALLRVADTGDACAFEVSIGDGRLVALTVAYPCDLDLFGSALRRLGATPGLQCECDELPVFATSSVNMSGERFLHLLNVDSFAKACRFSLEGRRLFGGRKLIVCGRTGLMLPLNVQFDGFTVIDSTAEIRAVGQRRLDLRLSQAQDVIRLEAHRGIRPSADYDVREFGQSRFRIRSRKDARLDDRLTIRLR